MTPPEKAMFEALCPKCQKFDYHHVVGKVPASLHIPPRVVLDCVKCGQRFYRVRKNGEANAENTN